MKKMIIYAVSCFMAALTLTACSSSPNLSGTQQIVVEGFDWGPVVTKTIISVDQSIDASSINPESFSVIETHMDYYCEAEGVVDPYDNPRTITAAYASDDKGNKVDENSKFITLELACGEEDIYVGDPFVWSGDDNVNYWSDPYEVTIALSDASTLASAKGTKIETIDIAKDGLIENMATPTIDAYDVTGSFTASDGITLTYASYAPEDDGNKHPLVIYLHGAGGGGTDPKIALFDSECDSLVEEEFQTIMNGAYVLIPQCDGFWLQTTEEKGTLSVNNGENSYFTQSLKELIDKYVEDNPNIDPNRIIIGGCSNGGYMALNMLFNYPEYFAAAYPISEAYKDSGITDEMLDSIKDVPMWFMYSKNDGVVNPEIYENNTIARLEKIAKDLHVSLYDKIVIPESEYVHGDGTTEEMGAGHESWIYFFDGIAKDKDGNDMWTWMSQQSK